MLSGWTKATCIPYSPFRGSGSISSAAGGRHVVQRGGEITHFEREVVHAGPALRQETPDGRVLPERGEQLDSPAAQTHRSSLHALFGKRVPALERGAEQPLVGGDGTVEIGDGDADVVDSAGLHRGRS